MRLNSKETVTAEDIVNHWSEHSLAELFRTYADEGEAERIAKAIGVARKAMPITRTKELAELVRKNVVPARRQGRIHPATQVFQALRMAVNSEAQHLEGLLQAVHTKLLPGGRFIVVAFHSGEDGLVKRTFQTWSRQEGWQLLTKKPIPPTEEEVKRNPRSRSAKLRGIQKP
jgi:16S rRNA (cytosine1402-N4)-methyltransferase